MTVANRDSLSQLIFWFSNYSGLLLSTEIKMYICITLLSRKKVINSYRIHININNIYFLTLMPVVKNCFKFFVSHTTAIIWPQSITFHDENYIIRILKFRRKCIKSVLINKIYEKENLIKLWSRTKYYRKPLYLADGKMRLSNITSKWRLLPENA